MKFQETKNIKTFYKPNILNINELKIRKNQKGFKLPPSGVLADNQRFSSLFKRAFFMPKNLGYNIGTTNLGLRCTIKFHLGFKEQLLVFPLLTVFCNNLSLPKRLTQRY